MARLGNPPKERWGLHLRGFSPFSSSRSEETNRANDLPRFRRGAHGGNVTRGNIRLKAKTTRLDEINRQGGARAVMYLTGAALPKAAEECAHSSHHPATNEGGFWHKQNLPAPKCGMDGLYMASPLCTVGKSLKRAGGL